MELARTSGKAKAYLFGFSVPYYKDTSIPLRWPRACAFPFATLAIGLTQTNFVEQENCTDGLPRWRVPHTAAIRVLP